MSTTDYDVPLAQRPTPEVEAAAEQIRRKAEERPDEYGFGRMFAHASAPVRVVVVPVVPTPRRKPPNNMGKVTPETKILRG